LQYKLCTDNAPHIALENELNSSTYGEEQPIEDDPFHGLPPECDLQVAPNIGIYSREVIERLLSFIPPKERAALIQTHPMVPPLQSQIRCLETSVDFVNLSKEEVAQQLSPSHNIPRASSLRSGDVQKEELISDLQFQKTIRQLAREEKKYQKRKDKKLVKEGKQKGKEQAMDKGICEPNSSGTKTSSVTFLADGQSCGA